jgi:CRP/FNR family transcriptional regulator, cyclic AMP receptor protein
MSWVEVLGYAASASVLATFCMSTMIPLRVLALASNVLFAAYGYCGEVYPVLILHAALLPINFLRLVQFRRLVNDVRNAHRGELSMDSLLPYMTKRDVAAGAILVRRGEKADRLYYLSEGELELTDFGKTLQRGAVFGEIGVFARNQERTATIVCRSDCRLYELSESTAKQLFFQDKSFGFAILQLIINRLLENNRRLLDAGTS